MDENGLKLEIEDDYRILREIIEQNFPLNEIVPEYDGMSQNTANCFCVFHKNTSSPSGKLYWDDEKEILVLYCFAEHRAFTSYDYVKLVLCDRKQKYKTPLDFLIHNMSIEELSEYVKLAKDKLDILTGSAREKKVEYINNLYNEYDNLEDFINALYSA